MQKWIKMINEHYDFISWMWLSITLQSSYSRQINTVEHKRQHCNLKYGGTVSSFPSMAKANNSFEIWELHCGWKACFTSNILWDRTAFSQKVTCVFMQSHHITNCMHTYTYILVFDSNITAFANTISLHSSTINCQHVFMLWGTIGKFSTEHSNRFDAEFCCKMSSSYCDTAIQRQVKCLECFFMIKPQENMTATLEYGSNFCWKKEGLFIYFKSYISFNIILSFNNSRYFFFVLATIRKLKEKVMRVTKPSW